MLSICEWRVKVKAWILCCFLVGIIRVCSLFLSGSAEFGCCGLPGPTHKISPPEQVVWGDSRKYPLFPTRNVNVPFAVSFPYNFTLYQALTETSLLSFNLFAISCLLKKKFAQEFKNFYSIILLSNCCLHTVCYLQLQGIYRK